MDCRVYVDIGPRRTHHATANRTGVSTGVRDVTRETGDCRADRELLTAVALPTRDCRVPGPEEAVLHTRAGQGQGAGG